MPRKTKQQKMAAALRRMKNKVETKSSTTTTTTTTTESPSTKTNTPTASTYNLENLRTKETKYSGAGSVVTKAEDYSFLAKDLRKIFILSLLAIILEIVISLTTRIHFAKLILLRFGIEI